MVTKSALRSALGELPFTAELDWMLRRKNHARNDHFSLERLQEVVAGRGENSRDVCRRRQSRAKRFYSFQRCIIGSNNRPIFRWCSPDLGHKVTLMTLPYSEWHKRMDNFTQRQRIMHTRETLKPMQSLVKHVSLLDLKPVAAIPDALLADIEQISLWDTQYTFMREEVDMNNPSDRAVYDLRLGRNYFRGARCLGMDAEPTNLTSFSSPTA